MSRLWTYENYVDLLSHENNLVRQWAFDAIEKQYPNRYTDGVSSLVSDPDSHLACAAPRYLGRHNAVQHGPAILESFRSGTGNIPSNCMLALAKMKYEPALETVMASLSSDINGDSLYGVFNYLGSVHHETGRETLTAAAKQIKDPGLQGNAILNLLGHNRPEDIPLVLGEILKSGAKGIASSLMEALADFWNARAYFKDISGNYEGKSLGQDPGEVFTNVLERNSHIIIPPDELDNFITLFEKKQYHNAVTAIMFGVQKTIRKRYPGNQPSEESRDLFHKDAMAGSLLEALSKKASVWKKMKTSRDSGLEKLIYLALAVYFSVIERGVYLKALSSQARIKDLIGAIQRSGPRFPEKLEEKIIGLAPVRELKSALSEELDTWGDIRTIKIMGRIGSKDFVPDLLRVLKEADSLDYIYEEAVNALRSLDESADGLILSAAKNNELGDWDLFFILEHLPYPESFDLVSEKWRDEKNEMSSYETFAHCLRGIGDKRGIKALQEIYNNHNDAGYIGDPLECLCRLHGVEIPELPVIGKNREEEKKRRELREKELDELFSGKNTGPAAPYQRETRKVGRNEPCPCGSGKKYKKCCMNT